jgi:hypothetical protein
MPERRVFDPYKIFGVNEPEPPPSPHKDVMRPSTGYPNIDRAFHELEAHYPQDLVGVKSRVGRVASDAMAQVLRSDPNTISVDPETSILYGTAEPTALLAHELQHVRDLHDPEIQRIDTSELFQGTPYEQQTIEQRGEAAARAFERERNPYSGRVERNVPIDELLRGIQRRTD